MLSNFDTAPDIAAWTLTGHAAITDVYFFISAPNVLFLEGRSVGAGGVFQSEATRTFTVTPGNVYPIRLWVDGTDGGAQDLQLRLTDSSGTQLFSKSGLLGYDLWEPTIYTAINSTVAVSLKVPYPVYTGGVATVANWKIDDFELEEAPAMALSKWTAISAALDLLRGITGGTFNTNFEGRVYSRLVLPTVEPTAGLPRVCLPLDQETERVEYENQYFNSTWRMSGYAFFADNIESDPLQSAGAEAAAKFRDDLIQAVMADQTLGGVVDSCEAVAFDTFPGGDEDATTWVNFILEFVQMGGAADLQAA